jgi:hypothetical protein
MRNEVVWQCFMNGPTWDGDLISKRDKGDGIRDGLLTRYEGWTTLTDKGLRFCVAQKYDLEKEKRARERRSHA